MDIKKEVKDIHFVPLIVSILITIIGILFIYSTTHNSPESDLFFKQIVWFILSLIAVQLINRIDYHKIVRISHLLYFALIAVLLILILVGRFIGGSSSWFFFRWAALQPSEFGKIILIIYLSKVVAEMERPNLGFKDIIKPAIILIIPMLLVAVQPDLGTALTYIPIFFGILFIARLRIWVILGFIFLSVMAVILAWSYVLKPYQKDRITTFLEPEKYKKGAGYQIYQSKIAIGSGGLTGKGYLEGTQSQLKFVPEQHNDFIFSVLAEETGLVGVCLTLLLYLILLNSFLNTALHARDKVGLLISSGFVFMLFFHLMLNVGMVVGLMPTTGIPLPLLSYGGSSLFSTYLGIGIVMNIRSRRFVYL